MACHRGRGSGQQTWVRHKPSWRRSPLTPPQSRRNLHRTGKESLGGHNRTLCTRTQEKGAVTPQETDPDLPGSVQESPGEAWVSGGRCRAADVRAWALLEEVAVVLIASTTVWPHQTTGREQPRPSTENWMKNLRSMAPTIRTRPSFPLSVSAIRKLP